MSDNKKEPTSPRDKISFFTYRKPSPTDPILMDTGAPKPGKPKDPKPQGDNGSPKPR